MSYTIEQLRERHSVRSFADREIETGLVNRLRSEATYINTHDAGLNFQLRFGDGEPMKGFARSYGMFRNVLNYMAPVIDPTFDHAVERAGYYSEQFVMECVNAGLGTCFVGGTYSRSHLDVTVEVYERIPFIVVFGYSEASATTLLGRLASKLTHRVTRQPRDFFDGTDEDYRRSCAEFTWLETALEAVACAPSGYNRQPVRLRRVETPEGPGIAAFTLDPQKDAAELGIAKFNVAAAVGGCWDWGEGGVFVKD